jgi:hypothetical protein
MRAPEYRSVACPLGTKRERAGPTGTDVRGEYWRPIRCCFRSGPDTDLDWVCRGSALRAALAADVPSNRGARPGRPGADRRRQLGRARRRNPTLNVARTVPPSKRDPPTRARSRRRAPTSRKSPALLSARSSPPRRRLPCLARSAGALRSSPQLLAFGRHQCSSGSERERGRPAATSAFASAGASAMIGVSPAPAEGMSGRSSRTTSIGGASVNRGTL